MDSYVIGVDIGGTGTKYGIVDKDGNVLHSSSMATNTHAQVDSFIDELYEKLSELIEKVGGVGRIKGIGVGAPNGNIYTGTIEYAPNLPWKGIIPFAKMLQDKFKLPVKLTNDANAAAVGEMMYGAAKGMKDFIMITLGTGVGSGIVANGQLIYGHDGFAGELGHTIIIPDGRLHPGTGKKGSLESYASATGVAQSAMEILKTTERPSLLRSIPIDKITSKDVFEAAQKDD
jgi:glucokinase